MTIKDTPAEVQVITREAYIYGFPIVDSNRVEYATFVDSSQPFFKAPWNKIHNEVRVADPSDTVVQAANTDTAYSELGLDLRAEPIVLTVPAIEENRYFSIQLIDSYTHNFAYIGSRTTGNGGGSFLIAGPDWKGDVPPDIRDVIRAETNLLSVYYRTQLFYPEDWDNVKKIQAGYKVQPLSEFVGKAPAPSAAKIEFPRPLSAEDQKRSLDFFKLLNFKLQFGPIHPSETDLMTRFARIGVGPGLNFDATSLSPEIRTAMERGMADAWTEYDGLKARIDKGEITTGDYFGTREYLKNNYLYRMAGAFLGIYGNSREEAMYPMYFVDADGKALDGRSRYILRFAPGQLPPANSFWSITLYRLPENFLYANPLNRYLINSPMLPNLKRDDDGGLTLLIQHDSPGKGNEANWIPAPKGPFSLYMRLYWPKPDALSGKWKEPPVTKVK